MYRVKWVSAREKREKYGHLEDSEMSCSSQQGNGEQAHTTETSRDS